MSCGVLPTRGGQTTDVGAALLRQPGEGRVCLQAFFSLGSAPTCWELPVQVLGLFCVTAGCGGEEGQDWGQKVDFSCVLRKVDVALRWRVVGAAVRARCFPTRLRGDVGMLRGPDLPPEGASIIIPHL